MMAAEIERRFILDHRPPADLLGAGTHIRQGYLAGEDHVEVRLRITDSEAVITVKAGQGRRRVEVEVQIADEDAESLWPSTEGRRIKKTRYRVPVAGHTAEVDIYEEHLAGLVSVEVEFESEGDADSFQAPDWFGREVTGDGRWSNAALARHGRPDT